MKTMTIKKLMGIVVIAALLQGPMAKAAYIGTFTAGSFYTFEIATSASVETAVTFMSVVRGRLQVDDLITVNGNLPSRSIIISRRAERIILLIDTRGGSSLIRINGGVPHEISADPEARIIADVVP